MRNRMIKEYMVILEAKKEEKKNFVQDHPYATAAITALAGTIGGALSTKKTLGKVEIEDSSPRVKMDDSFGFLQRKSSLGHPIKKDSTVPIVPGFFTTRDMKKSSIRMNPKNVSPITGGSGWTVQHDPEKPKELKAYTVPPKPGTPEWHMAQENPTWTIDPFGRKEVQPNEYYANQFIKMLPGSRLATPEEIKSKRKTGFNKPRD